MAASVNESAANIAAELAELQAQVSLATDNRDAVDTMNRIAAAHGGHSNMTLAQELGFMGAAATSPTSTDTCGEPPG